MSLLDKLFNRKSKVEEKEIIETSEVREDEDEITAVIAATIAAMEEEETVAAITAALSVILGKGPEEFIVRNIRRTSEMESLWAHAGRMKLMR
ncbi:MAG TPA: hypothetical protein GX396_05410 [Tissierellia bacterium]|jgi:hypothetical protein|nr:hypothetical protein [Tissierellia bacterium]